MQCKLLIRPRPNMIQKSIILTSHSKQSSVRHRLRFAGVAQVWVAGRDGDALTVKLKLFHGDGVGGTTRGTKRAADTGGFILQHHTTDGIEFRTAHAANLFRSHFQGVSKIVGTGLVRAKLTKPNESNEIFRTNIHAAIAGDTGGRVKDSVHIAAQTARSLTPGHSFG